LELLASAVEAEKAETLLGLLGIFFTASAACWDKSAHGELKKMSDLLKKEASL
jgi:hypothetical protein